MTAAHLDYDALADLAEGTLDDDSATTAEEHLATCADCRDRAAEVAEVSRVLAEAPIPPMPAHLVDRLAAAIATEVASHAPAHRHARRFQLVAAAAAAVVAVGGGAIVARTVLYDQESKTATSSQPPVEEPSRTHAVGPTRPQIATAVPYSVLQSGTKYTAADLASQVRTTLSQHPATGRHAMTGADGGLEGCVTRVGGGKVPLLVDSATYDGRPATVIALPGADAGHVDVWIVGGACSSDNTDLISHQQVAH